MAHLSSPRDIRAALESVAKQLAHRTSEDADFSLPTTRVPPEVLTIAAYIKDLRTKLKEYQAREAASDTKRAAQLAEAYNAIQARNDEMTRDLETARRIQLRLVPHGNELPERPELDCFGRYASMDKVGGDLYDIMRIGRNAYGLLMADVSGHGLPSALITALVKVAFRTKVRWGASVAELAHDVNQELYPILSDLDYYVTAFFGILNLEDGSFRFTNCGHHPALLLKGLQDLPVELDSRGRFLGAFDELGASEESVVLEPGDTVFAFTDGIIESRNFLDEEFGQERLMNCLGKANRQDHDCTLPGRCERLVETVRRSLDTFTMGAPARDDQSMFALQVLARSEAPPFSSI